MDGKFEAVATRVRELLTDLGIDPLPAIVPAYDDDACDVTWSKEIRLQVGKGPEDLDYYARHVVGHYLCDLHVVDADKVADIWALGLGHDYCPGYDQGVGELIGCLDMILDGRDLGQGTCREPWQSQRTKLIALVAMAEGLQTVLRQIADWARAYPLEVFPEPDLKLAASALRDAGLTLDAVSASAMRHVVATVAKIAAEALGNGQ